uniref:Uncharacterized protein n=1 Tax=Arundo donax TaxID=35708 RepID=A0A0A9SCL8_ARUDO
MQLQCHSVTEGSADICPGCTDFAHTDTTRHDGNIHGLAKQKQKHTTV